MSPGIADSARRLRTGRTTRRQTGPAIGRGRSSASCGFGGDDRAMSSVVGKALELGVLAVFVGLLVTTFYGGVVPEYRAAAGASVADRTTASVATGIETAVPSTDESIRSVEGERTLDVPRTIQGDTYAIRIDETGALVLDHPRDELSRTVPLSLPGTVTAVEGSVRSGETVVVIVESTRSGVVLRLEGR